MKCTLKQNIANISGKSGNVLFKTYTKSDGSKETRVYLLPRKGRGYGYNRKTKPSAAEQAARELFTRRQALVQELFASGQCRTKADAWKVAKEQIV